MRGGGPAAAAGRASNLNLVLNLRRPASPAPSRRRLDAPRRHDRLRQLVTSSAMSATPRSRPSTTACSSRSPSNSTWTVTGTSYLTALSLDATSGVAGRARREGHHDGRRHADGHRSWRQLHRRHCHHPSLSHRPAQAEAPPPFGITQITPIPNGGGLLSGRHASCAAGPVTEHRGDPIGRLHHQALDPGPHAGPEPDLGDRHGEAAHDPRRAEHGG